MLSQNTRFLSSFRQLTRASKRHFWTGSGKAATGAKKFSLRRADVALHHRSLVVRGLASTATTTKRGKSSLAVLDDSDEEEDVLESILRNHPSRGHAAAAADVASALKSHDEAWMINLGRNDDNIWLSKPREDHWWTGVHPRDCPGRYHLTCCVRWAVLSHVPHSPSIVFTTFRRR